MAGHSKWANIQHRKKAQDNKRGKLFTKLIREITVSAKMGGGDPASNPRLRQAVDKALSSNMTRDTVDRAIKRGAGSQDDTDYQEIRYEGYGNNGVAVLVDCLTDNRNRTVAEVRHAFTKHGGNLGTEGSVAYLFNRIGILSFAPGANEEDIMEVALEAGADDIETHDDGSIDVITDETAFLDVKENLIDADLQPEVAEITMKASTEVELDVEQSEKLLKMLDVLEDLDDVQNVHSNAKFADDAFSG
ncbi:MAG TPA: YebC/PmpR family DNA-binding transcriptional regulator [Gammaproteobacteria bacterium]|nr:YebC/PmpR family DNA-binding transcriptional regulator [Gammaproteobacteria bacterium]